MPSFIIEHQCPQCGAPAELEETDRLFQCEFCRVRSFLSAPDVFRYTLPHKAPAGRELIYFPYWRFKGALFSCVPGRIQNRFIDVSQQAIASAHFPFSMGFRSQTQKLRFAVADRQGLFLQPRMSKAELLQSITERFSALLPQPVLHQAQIGETFSLLYAPFYVEHHLKDAMINETVSECSSEELAPLLQQGQEPNWPITFLSTLCPGCGWDLSGEKDALALTCANCQSIWWPKGEKLEQLKAAYVPDTRDTTVYLPFWRIRADVGGVQLRSYTDLIRIANLPKVPQPNWDERAFHFWSPAFKVRPQSFLNFAAHLTVHQIQDTLTSGLPAGALRGVSLPLQEAVESLTLILAFFARPRQRMEALLPDIRITPKSFALVYLPFQEGPHELIHPTLNLAISKNLLLQARNL